MKYLILLILLLISCTRINERIEKAHADQELSRRADIFFVEIDGCEYLANFTHGSWYVYTHKGNCKYCLARNKK